jgi:hypothetical protein
VEKTYIPAYLRLGSPESMASERDYVYIIPAICEETEMDEEDILC